MKMPTIKAATIVLATLAAFSAMAHQIGSHTSGEEPSGVPGVHTCANFEWTKKRRCGTYHTTKHDWKVVNNCPRAVKVIWADNAYNRPIERNEETDKPIAEKSADLRAGKTMGRSVECVDKAEIEICIAYVYPPLQEHSEVDCDDFFDR